MKHKKKQLKIFLKNEVVIKGEIYLKLSFTIFFVLIFLITFFTLDGYKYFYSNTYANEYQGYGFQIHTIDVEQGDCFLIKLPTNQCMMIDAGEEKYSNAVCEYIHQFLLKEKMQKIDYFVLTHPDSDHIGGAKSILSKFEVENLLRPPVYTLSENKSGFATENFEVDESLIYDETIKVAYKTGCNLKFFNKGISYNFKDCKIEVLSPESKKYTSSNDYSAVIMITCQNKKFLFMGDAEEDIEKTLINQYGKSLKADVLKVGHHGSITSTSQQFLDVVKPSYAILTCFNNSKYFPNKEVVKRLENSGTKILSTAKQGNFVISVRNDLVVYSVASRPANFLAIIFSFVLISVLIVWKMPLKENKETYFTKNA